MKKSPLIIGIILLVVGILLGYVRLLNIFAGRTGIPILNQFTNLHSSMLIIGFITIVIIYERVAGLQIMSSQEGLTRAKQALYSTIIGYILYILGSVLRNSSLLYISSGILFIGGLLFITYLTIIGKNIDRNSYYLSLTSLIAYLSIIYFLTTKIKNYTAYSLLLLSYPLIFILAERIELSKFIPHPRKDILNITPILSIMVIITLIPLNTIAYTKAVSISALFILITTLLMYYFENINIKRLLKTNKPLMKYQAIHLATAYITSIFGATAYIIFTTIYTQLPILDIAIHLIALGFIGNMLLGHGPAVLTTIEGKTIDEARVNIYPYILLNTSIFIRAIADIAKLINNPIYKQLYELSGLLIIILIPVFIIMVRRASK